MISPRPPFPRLNSGYSLVILVCFLLISGGCVSSPPPKPTPASVAEHYAVEKFGFTHAKVDHVSEGPTGYSVIVWDLPYRPGAHILVYLSKDLEVTDCFPGR